MKIKTNELLYLIVIILITVVGILLNTTFACRIVVLLLLVVCITKGMKEKSIVNPYYLFSFVPFTLLIYSKISRYHLVLTTNTWLLAIINISSFLIALSITKPFKSIRRCIGVGNDNQAVKHIIILMLFYYIPTVYNRVTGQPFFLSSVFYLFLYPALIIALKTKKKGIIIAIIAVSILSWISYVSKMTILTFALTMLVGYEKYYVDNKQKKKRMIALVCLGILLMIFSFGFANQGRGNANGFSGSALDYYTTYGNVVWNSNAKFFMPYMYLTTPWSNLQYVMETQDTRTYGLWLIKPFIGYLQLDNIFSDMYFLTAYSSFNTFTYLACCFKDFGFWGSCLSSVILGVYTKRIYTRYIVSRSPLDIACYALVAQAVAEMFFSNHFFTQSYPFTILIIMGIYKVVFCKGCPVEIEEMERIEEYDG